MNNYLILFFKRLQLTAIAIIFIIGGVLYLIGNAAAWMLLIILMPLDIFIWLLAGKTPFIDLNKKLFYGIFR